jgi:hypothetical protein
MILIEFQNLVGKARLYAILLIKTELVSFMSFIIQGGNLLHDIHAACNIVRKGKQNVILKSEVN